MFEDEWNAASFISQCLTEKCSTKPVSRVKTGYSCMQNLNHPSPQSLLSLVSKLISITSSPSVSTAAPELNGVAEPSVAKRLKGTPERIELENYRLSMQREELEEVPEETLAEHNLSSVLDKGTELDDGSRCVLKA